MNYMSNMPGAAKEKTRKKKSRDDDERNSQNKKLKLNPKNKSYSSLSKKNVNNCLSEDNANGSLKNINKTTAFKTKTSKRQPSMSDLKDTLATFKTKESGKSDDIDVESKRLKRRRRKKGKNNVGIDEASRLQRRTRYLLIKIKLEQNLIDAYSAEGWKGQSREKIKPEKELQRAKKQILKCKLGIRDVIHQLDLLSSVGRINDSKVAPDGSVHHEHIICAKCKLREAFPENDIILCDGTCNCAFHQKCLNPPLPTENIPPGDEGWFCKFCKSKMEVLEATNAHLGTHFAMDSNWQDVFKEEAAIPDGENSIICQEEEWPSDDSEDDDYDPEKIEHICSDSMSRSESDASEYSSSFLCSLEDEALVSPGRYEERIKGSFDGSLELVGVDSAEINNGEVLCRPRQRAAVDYTKLYDEMFGKNATENEQISEDEDWGPTKRRRKGKETDAASTLITLGETDKKPVDENTTELKEKQLSSKKIKRPIFRLPHNAVEKLRLVFAENELPVRAVRESLSKQLGLEFEKVNKWFKNARYLALKVRKAGRKNLSEDASSIHNESVFQTAMDENADQMASKDNPPSQTPKSLKKYTRRRNGNLLTNSLNMKQRRKQSFQMPDRSKMSFDFGDDVSLKHLREKAKQAKKKLKGKSRVDMLEAEAKLERLYQIKSRVEKLQQILLQLPNQRFSKDNTLMSTDSTVIYVPIADLREKR